jgi:hypothetical protein
MHPLISAYLQWQALQSAAVPSSVLAVERYHRALGELRTFMLELGYVPD